MKPFLLAVIAAVAAMAATACGTSSPGAAPTSTVTVTVTPTSTPSSPAVTSPTTTAAAGQAAAQCSARYLNGTIGLTQGTAGSEYVNLVFKNLNNVPCTMYGYPGVTQQAGKPLSEVGQPSSENPTTPRELVTLAPAGVAYVTLQIADAANFPASACTQVKSGWLAVIPPNQTAPLYIEFSSTACQGSAKLLTVTAMRPGTGG